jgi:glycosyltransferase involved in cell wall biosynthesis
MSVLYFVLPEDIDDPRTPSGGNRYDRRVIEELGALGWTVHEVAIWGDLSEQLAKIPPGSLVLHDGLVVSAEPAALGAGRRDLVLVHLPLFAPAEGETLHKAAAVVATSARTGRQLVEHYGLPPAKVHVAPPGVDRAPESHGTGLLCVAAVIPRKGHDLLIEALRGLDDLPWRCVCAGALDRDPAFAAGLPPVPGLTFAGPLTGDDLDAAYAGAGLLVLPSRAEPYGMVVTEALVRGIPVLATDVDGVPEALGRAPDGTRPGILVPPGDPAALEAALRRWLTDERLRHDLKTAALARRDTLEGWDMTARRLAEVLA